MNTGITPRMRWSHGELEIKVDGERVYSYKEEHPLPTDATLLERVQSRLQN